jgi:hypothetical protein
VVLIRVLQPFDFEIEIGDSMRSIIINNEYVLGERLNELRLIDIFVL